MAAEIFTAISALRMVLDSETDADSPDNETTFAAIRVAIESLFLILLGTGDSGTVTDLAESYFEDTGGFGIDEHNGRTVLFTSGNAKGNFYTIDDTQATVIVCTGDTLISDGVAIGDYYVILYDIKTNTGHTHDDLNSPNVVLADASVATAKYIDNSVTMEKIEHGTLHALPCESDQMTALTENGENGFVTKATYKIYVPATATTIGGTIRCNRDTDGVDCNVRFTAGGATSEIYNVDHTGYAWSDEITLDCSGLSGWVDFCIQLDAQAARTVSVQGFSFKWA